MDIREILKKARGMLGNPDQPRTIDKRSLNEKELEVYLERERQDKIKKMLNYYRNKEEKDFMQGKNMLNEPMTLKDNKEFYGEKPKVKKGKKKTVNFFMR